MKLRLPRHLVLAFVLAGSAMPGVAAVSHTGVSLNTYVDFATNSGRYAVGATNELLDYIRMRDGGVTIQYTGGQEDYILPHEMISFDSVADDGNMTVVGYSYVVTVAHNASQMSPSFSGHDYGVGDARAIKYMAVEEYGDRKSFVHDIAHDEDDYKVSRLTKLVTDAAVVQMVGGAGSDYKGQLVYRVAGGLQKVRDESGKEYQDCEKLVYQVGGVASITGWSQSASDENIRVGAVSGTTSWGASGIGDGSPLPFGGQPGDSGSPYFVWDGDAETGSYKFLMAHRASYADSGRPELTVGCEATDWVQETIESDTVRVDMSLVSGTLCINGVQKVADKGGATDVVNGVEFTVAPAKGYLTHAGGTLNHANGDAVSFNGIETGLHTWKSLSDLKDSATWYAYDDAGNEGYLNATGSVLVVGKDKVVAEGVTYAKLYMTQNMVFEAAADSAAYTINVTDDTDFGAGYLHFAANGKKDVTFNVVSEKSSQLDSAGYVVDAGVLVNVSLRSWNPEYMREWRKVGEGTLNICGKDGNNEIFLNVGGAGRTLLNQSGGYAAYNVLVNTGSVVVIKDAGQIKRDFTFGSGGGVLDMNGNKMDWYTTDGEKREGCFTINALTEEAVITNSSSQHASLTYKEGGSTVFAGSFQDSAESSLGITYSVDGGTWELNSIRTRLTHADSGLTVEQGTVKLAGTHTVHGYGSYHTGDSADFSTRENDWHYADATMNVTVKKGGTFELESHARLTGSVTVESGGSYIMHEGVQYAEEYIEGGERLESTADIADYYGHKGDVSLEDTGTLTWKRGSKEVATLKTNNAGIAEMTSVVSTISSETQLRLASAKGETGRISAASLTLQTGVILELCGLYVDASSAIYSESGARVSLQESVLEFSEANTSMNSSVLKSALTLNLCGNEAVEVNFTAGTQVMELESDMLGGVLSLSCDQLMLDLRGLEIPGEGLVRVSFGNQVQFEDQKQMTISAQTNAGCVVGYYAAAQAGCVYFIIPEPVTSTLSLVALVALAARRRRRKA